MARRSGLFFKARLTQKPRLGEVLFFTHTHISLHFFDYFFTPVIIDCDTIAQNQMDLRPKCPITTL